jgi:hypothetical protein
MKTRILLCMAFTIAFFQETYSKQVADQVCTGDVTLSSQAEVDAFNCTEVIGNLHIFGQDITNLKSLALLEKVSGGLMISDTNLKTLDELSTLHTIGGDRLGSGLSIRDNPELLSLSGFPSLREILSGHVNISNNPKLASITGFNSLAIISMFIGGPGSLTIEQNDALTKLEGFSALIATGNFRIINNPKLLALDGFPSLRSVVEDLEIIDNESLKTINGLKVVQGVGSFERASITRFTIFNNASLETLAGLSSLESVLGALTQVSISSNPSLKNLDGLSSLTTIFGETGASFEISNNAMLEDIEGLSALRPKAYGSSYGALSINVSKNPSLTRCSGLLPYFESLGLREVLTQYNNGLISLAENGSGCTVEDIVASVTQAIFKFNVIDIRNGNVVTSFPFNVTLDLANPDFNNWAIQAVTVPQQVGSVEFIFTNESVFPHEEFTQTTNVFPYTFTFPAGLRVGTYSITANVYSLPDKQGEQGLGISRARVDIINSSPTTGFTLMDQRTQAVIQNFQDEITIDVARQDFAHLMLQANSDPQHVGSVEFVFDEQIRRTENGFPYQFILPVLTLGTHTVRAEFYSKDQKQGVKEVSRTATFKVIYSITVESFDVVDLSGQILMTLHDGDKINIKDPAFKTFLIRANTSPTIVNRVFFTLNERLVAEEYGFPYELFVNRPPGDYTVEAFPTIRIATGYAQTSVKIRFKIVSEDPGASGQFVIADQSDNESLLKLNETQSVSIFPVPVDNELRVKIDDVAGKDPVITIRNIYGVSVYHESYSKSESINTLHLPKGIYYLHVTGDNGFQKVIRFLKE